MQHKLNKEDIKTYKDLIKNTKENYMEIKRIVTRSGVINYQKVEETVEFVYDKDDPDSVVEFTTFLQEFEQEVLNSAQNWYNKIKELDGYGDKVEKQESKPAQKKKPSGGKSGYQKKNYSKGKKKQEQDMSEYEAIVEEKEFGSPKQWKIITDNDIDTDDIDDYNELKEAVRQILNG